MEQDWRELAACKGMDAAIFFPEIGPALEAKRICSTCRVVEDCLAYALEVPERHGIFGGLSERQRRFLRHPESKEARKVQERAAKLTYRQKQRAS